MVPAIENASSELSESLEEKLEVAAVLSVPPSAVSPADAPEISIPATPVALI